MLKLFPNLLSPSRKTVQVAESYHIYSRVPFIYVNLPVIGSVDQQSEMDDKIDPMLVQYFVKVSSPE